MEQYNEQSARNVINQAKELAGGKKEIKPVASGTMVKKSGLKKFFDNFIANDAKDIKDHVVWDILVPSAKNTAYSMVMNALGMSLGINGKNFTPANGGSRLDRTPSGTVITYKNYSNCYDNNNNQQNFRNFKYGRNRYSINDINFDTEEECRNVLFDLDGIMDQYHFVTVGQFYRSSGIKEEYIDYPDEQWGWDEAAIKPRNGGKIPIVFANGYWHICMPDPIPYSG